MEPTSGDARRRGPPHGAALAAVAFLLAALTGVTLVPGAAADDAGFVVNSTDDLGDAVPGDGACNDTSGTGNCTLRAAIEEANALAGADTITFAIPGGPPVTIAVGVFESPLPAITETVTIDGTTQPGYAWGAPSVILDGFNVCCDAGLSVVDTDNVTIRGLQIQNFPDGGISLSSLSQFSDHAVYGNVVRDNGGAGVSIDGEDRARIGSSAAGDGNVITENSAGGITISGGAGHVVAGNWIGVDMANAARGNLGPGVFMGFTADATVEDNVIGSNTGHGVHIADSVDTLVARNSIGTDMSRTLARGNGGDGIAVTGAASLGNDFQENQILHNAGLGIDLADDGVTLNDLDDVDASPNRLQNFPVLDYVFRLDPDLTIEGHAEGPPADNLIVEVFASPSCDLSGHGEGALFVASFELGGTESFTVTLPSSLVPVGYEVFTAVARNTATGDASEFGPCESQQPSVAIVLEDPRLEADLVHVFSNEGPSRVNRYVWNFGDGTEFTYFPFLKVLPSHSWSSVGIYRVQLEGFEDLEDGSSVFLGRDAVIVYVYVETFDEFGVGPGATHSLNVSDHFDILLTADPAGDGTGGAGGARLGTTPLALFSTGMPANVGGTGVVAFRFLEADEFSSAGGFSQIEVRVYYDPAVLASRGVPESLMSLWYFNGEGWFDTVSYRGDTIPGEIPLMVFDAGRNVASNYVWAIVDHTSTFAAAGSQGGGGTPSPSPSPSPSPEPSPTEDPTPDPPPDDGPTEGDGSAGDGGPGTGTSDLFEGSRIRIVKAGGVIGDPLSGLGGTISVEIDGLPEGTQIVYVLIDADGVVHVLGRPSSPYVFDTSVFANGYYTLEAREDDSSDSDPTVYASEQIFIYNPRAPAEQVLGAAVAGAAIVGLGALIAQTFWSTFAQATAEAAKESALAVGEDRLRTRRFAKTRRWIPWLAFAAAIALLGFFFTFEGVESAYRSGFVQEFLAVLPIVGAAAFLFFCGQFSLEVLSNRISGAQSRFKFLWPGAVALAVSAMVFRTAFGYPGYVAEAELKEDRVVARMKGIRALGVFAVMLTLLLPFLAAGYLWRWDIAEAAMVVGLVALCTSTLPVAPLPGADVWRWRHDLSLATLAGSFVLFFGFQVAFLPIYVYVVLGVLGLPVFVGSLAWLAVRRRSPRPQWYARVVARYAQYEAWVASHTPAWFVRFRAARRRAAERLAGRVGAPLRRAARTAAGRVHRRRAARRLP